MNRKRRRYSDGSSDSEMNNSNESKFDRIEIIQKLSENRFEVRCFSLEDGTSFRGTF